MAAGQVVKVKRETIEACIRCPLCNKLLREATTISLCLHTFCRKCICEKFSDEELDSCPICNVDLGCLPVEKLRPDHNLQDIRSKIFPLKRKKVAVVEASPSSTFPKRKERSLSSLVVTTPKVPVQAGLTGRRSKASARKSTPFRSTFSDHTFTKDDSDEDNLKCSPENSILERKLEPSHEGVADNGVEVKADLWTPLNCLVEAANRTKPSKPTLGGGSVGAHEPPSSSTCETYNQMLKTKPEPSNGFDVGCKPKSNDHNSSSKRRRLASAKKRGALMEEKRVTDSFKRNNPVWFSLIAHDDQKGEAILPQIPSSFLRIKDGKMPVSMIQRYLVKKLDLQNEMEVEILLRGQPIVSSQTLNNLVEQWSSKAAPARKSPPAVGSSGKDYVMVLHYCRKRTSM